MAVQTETAAAARNGYACTPDGKVVGDATPGALLVLAAGPHRHKPPAGYDPAKPAPVRLVPDSGPRPAGVVGTRQVLGARRQGGDHLDAGDDTG
jgi:hypothetical protein